MHTSHEPANYTCPFCETVAGALDEHTAAGDVVAREELAFARIAPKWWPRNPGSALVIPTQHIENIYSSPRAFSRIGFAPGERTAR